MIRRKSRPSSVLSRLRRRRDDRGDDLGQLGAGGGHRALRLHHQHVLGDDLGEQTLAGPEVVADRGVVALTGVPDDVAQLGAGDPVACEPLLAGTHQELAGTGCVSSHSSTY